MSTSSATDLSSDFSSLSSSSPRPLPYQHPQPPSMLSLSSQRRRPDPMPTKNPRFYSSPLDDDPASTPLQVYGLEQRPSSFIEAHPPRARLLRQVSHALDDIKEDVSLQVDARSTVHKIKRRSTLIFHGDRSSSSSNNNNNNNKNNNAPASDPTSASGGRPRSRGLSIMPFDAWSSPSRRLSRRLTRRLSSWSLPRTKSQAPNTASISSPNLIGSSTRYAAGQDQSPVI